MLEYNLIEKAKDINVSVVAIHNTSARICPYFILGDQRQSLNKVSDLNQKTMLFCLDFCDGNGNSHLVSVFADGVGCDRINLMDTY